MNCKEGFVLTTLKMQMIISSSELEKFLQKDNLFLSFIHAFLSFEFKLLVHVLQFSGCSSLKITGTDYFQVMQHDKAKCSGLKG